MNLNFSANFMEGVGEGVCRASSEIFPFDTIWCVLAVWSVMFIAFLWKKNYGVYTVKKVFHWKSDFKFLIDFIPSLKKMFKHF